MGSVMWRVAPSALCKVCAIKYVTNVNDPHDKLWMDYVSECTNCNEEGRDALPWAELFTDATSGRK